MIKRYPTPYLFHLAVALLLSGTLQAQVKFGDNPTVMGASSLLELESTDKALVLPRISDTTAVATPLNGMLVYDLSRDCIRSYEEGAWSECYTTQQDRIDNLDVSIRGVKDRFYGDGLHDFIYMPIVGEDGKTWLNNNLGANYANRHHPEFNPRRQAASATDFNAYGSLYQWFRISDGHELINWTSSTSGTPVNGTTAVQADDPSDALFILSSGAPNDWRVNHFYTAEAFGYSADKGVYGNCPQGYTMASSAELTAYRVAAGFTNAAGAANSLLRITTAGRRAALTGALVSVGTQGFYWTRDDNGIGIPTSTRWQFAIGSVTSAPVGRANGSSVRCIIRPF